jgi:hypothetical protein
MESTPKKRKLNQDEIPRITLRGFFRRALIVYLPG